MQTEKITEEEKEAMYKRLGERVGGDFYLRMANDHNSMELLYKGHFLDRFDFTATDDGILKKVGYWGTQTHLFQTAEEAR